MIDLQQFQELDPAEVPDEKIMDAMANDLKAVDTENFDPYSFRGERVLNKIAKKHAGKIAEVDMLLEVIDDEMARRDHYNEQQRYIEGGNYKKFDPSITTEEFLESEQKKIKRTRKQIED